MSEELAPEQLRLATRALDAFSEAHGFVVPSDPSELRKWLLKLTCGVYLAGFQDGAEDACVNGF